MTPAPGFVPLPLLAVAPDAAAGVVLRARPIAPSLQAADCRRLHGAGAAAGWISGTVGGTHAKAYSGLCHCWLAVLPPPAMKQYTARPSNMAAAKSGLKQLRVGAVVFAGRFGAGSAARKAAAAAPATDEPSEPGAVRGSAAPRRPRAPGRIPQRPSPVF